MVYEFSSADTSDRDEVEARLKGMLQRAESGPQTKVRREVIRHLRQQIETLDERYAEAYDRYIKFCQQVIIPVIQEPEPNFIEPLPYDFPEEEDDES